MNPPLRAKCQRVSILCRKWPLIFAVAVLVFLIAEWESGTSNGLEITFVVNTNGIPTLLGTPLGNGASFVFLLRTLHRTKVHVHLLYPIAHPGTDAYNTNVVHTMDAIIKGLSVPTNVVSGPSPYE